MASRAAMAKPPTLGALVHGSLTECAWGQVARAPRFAPIREHTAADVVVVGAGVAGLTAALQLQRAGKDVVLLESKVVGSGRSGRTEGLLAPWKTCTLRHLSRSTAAGAVRSHRAAQAFVAEVVKTQQISCGLQLLDSYVFSSDDLEAEKVLREEAAAAHAAGLGTGQLTSGVELGAERRLDQAIDVSPTLALDPVRYMDGLADAASREGVRIYEQSRVRQYDHHTATTMEGVLATASDGLVITTGTPITKGLIDSSVRALALHSKHVPRRRYAIAMTLPADAAKEGVFFDLSDSPHCVRISKQEGGQGLTLIASGEEHDQGLPASEFADFHGRLEAWVRGRWPRVQERSHQWSYQLFETVDHLPFHGKDPTPGYGYHVSFGDCGEALASETLGGLIISDQILGKDNEFSSLYSPSRRPGGLPVPPVKPQYVINTVEAVAKQVLPQFSSPDIEELAAGSGAIMQKGLHKLAVYKDPAGDVHAHSAVCPHLGCLIQWNPVESQWNCPCHGSCFDAMGGNMGGGPATIDLEPMPDAV